VRSHVHDDGADEAEDDGGGERHEGLRGEGADDVLEETVDAGGEDGRFAGFGVVALDDTDAAERFGEAAGDFGVDLGALAEDGADDLEGSLEDEGEGGHDDEGQQRHAYGDVHEVGEGEQRGEDATDEVDDTGADEVADAFDVVHDAGDEGAGAVLVVEGDGEFADVLLDLHAELGDEALAGFGEQLGEGVGSNALDERGGEDGADDPGKQSVVVLVEDLIDERAEGGGEHQGAGAVDDHQEKAAGEEEAARADERPYLGPDVFEFGLGAALGEIGGDGAAGTAGGCVGRAHAGGATDVGGSVVCHELPVYAVGRARPCGRGGQR